MRCWCESENITLYVRLTNISEGGACLHTCTPLKPGSRAILRWNTGIKVEATVVWSNGKARLKDSLGMGLRFENLSLKALGSLRALMTPGKRIT